MTIRRPSKSAAMDWVKVLTPILIALLAMRSAGKAVNNSETTAASVATVVADQNAKAQDVKALAKRVTKLERAVYRPGAAGPAAPGKREAGTAAESPGALQVLGNAVVAPGRWAWAGLKAIFGG